MEECESENDDEKRRERPSFPRIAGSSLRAGVSGPTDRRRKILGLKRDSGKSHCEVAF